jgi:Iodothyronine deiodinase
MKNIWIWLGVSLGAILLAAFIGLSILAGSPKDAYGMVRYALPHMHRGTLRVGDDAPDARVLALDGTTGFHIRERSGRRPLVMIFGSFT